MKISETLIEKLIDKSLETYKVTYKEILNDLSKIHWTDKYVWQSENEYNVFTDYALKKIKKERQCNNEEARYEYNQFDGIYGLRCAWIYKKIGELF